MAERAGNVEDRLANFERDQVAGAFAHRLDHQGDGAAGRIGVGDGQWDALGAVAEAHDDELAGLADFGDAAGLEVEAGDVRTELDFGGDEVHAAEAERAIFRAQALPSPQRRQVRFCARS